MKMKLSLKSILSSAVIASSLVAGSASSATLTGKVAWFSTNGAAGNYTFVNVLTPTGNAVAYYIGDNTAIATVIDNAKRLNQSVTVVTDSANKITQVR